MRVYVAYRSRAMSNLSYDLPLDGWTSVKIPSASAGLYADAMIEEVADMRLANVGLSQSACCPDT